MTFKARPSKAEPSPRHVARTLIVPAIRDVFIFAANLTAHKSNASTTIHDWQICYVAHLRLLPVCEETNDWLALVRVHSCLGLVRV